MKTDFPEATQELEAERQRLARQLDYVVARLKKLVPDYTDRRALRLLVKPRRGANRINPAD